MTIAAHKRNLLAELAGALRDKSEQSSLTTDQAFNRVAAQWLGYDVEANENMFVDGAGDRGIDFWFQSDSGFDIFQCKTHDLDPAGDLDLTKFDNTGVTDIARAKIFLLSETEPEIQNDLLREFRHHWDHAVASRRSATEPESMSVNLGLVLLGEGLTPPARKEFEDFCETLRKPYHLGGVPVEFRATLYIVDDLLARCWRLDNREWRDSKGTKRDTIDLHPEKIDEALIKKDSAVFYCRAYDLVRAYQEFGYQIFEPNVRCNISHSKVNDAIRESVLHRASREEFRFLNNGVTVVCQSLQKPSQNKPFFRVTKPGVVNGLQTVFALHEAYGALSQDDKQHLEENCFVLLRLLHEQSLRDLGRLVRATNTQNPMQARNLVSNNNEQIQFEKLFAKTGWFYERKQGAWEAFAADPDRWRSLPNNRKGDFQIAGAAGRPRVRRVDNEVLGQTWLSFIGFSEEAVHSKRDIFENEKWYDFIFLHAPTNHGHDFQYKLEEARQHCLTGAPSPQLMLASYLAREAARKLAPTAKENRESAIKRLGLRQASKDQIDLRLAEDAEYVLGQTLNGMSFVFVEFLGFVLFKSVDQKQLLSAGQRLLDNGSFSILSRQLDFEKVRQNIIDQKFEQNDVLAVTWWAFRHVLDEMIGGGAWLASYRSARNKTRFNHSTETRGRLHKAALELNQFTERTQLTRTWAIGINPGRGLFGFVRGALLP